MSQLLAFAGRKISYYVCCHDSFKNMEEIKSLPDMDNIKDDAMFIIAVNNLGCKVEETIIIRRDGGAIFVCKCDSVQDAIYELNEDILTIKDMLNFLKKIPNHNDIQILVNGEEIQHVVFDGTRVEITADEDVGF